MPALFINAARASGALRILADELGPFLDGLAVAGLDGRLVAFGFLQRAGLRLRHGAEEVEDARRAFVERMGAQKLLETLQGERLVLLRERVHAHLELGVNDRVLAFGPLRAVGELLHVALPGGDGLGALLLLAEDRADAEDGAHLQVRQVRRRRGAEFLIELLRRLAVRQPEAPACDEVAVSLDRIVGPPGALAGLGDHPGGPHRPAAFGKRHQEIAAGLQGRVQFAVAQDKEHGVAGRQAAGVADGLGPGALT